MRLGPSQTLRILSILRHNHSQILSFVHALGLKAQLEPQVVLIGSDRRNRS